MLRLTVVKVLAVCFKWLTIHAYFWFNVFGATTTNEALDFGFSGRLCQFTRISTFGQPSWAVQPCPRRLVKTTFPLEWRCVVAKWACATSTSTYAHTCAAHHNLIDAQQFKHNLLRILFSKRLKSFRTIYAQCFTCLVIRIAWIGYIQTRRTWYIW